MRGEWGGGGTRGSVIITLRMIRTVIDLECRHAVNLVGCIIQRIKRDKIKTNRYRRSRNAAMQSGLILVTIKIN